MELKRREVGGPDAASVGADGMCGTDTASGGLTRTPGGDAASAGADDRMCGGGAASGENGAAGMCGAGAAGLELKLELFYQKQDIWKKIPDAAVREDGFSFETAGARYYGSFCETETGLDYTVGFEADYETQLRIQLSLPDQEDYYHVIPCNIFGDNHAEEAKLGEFPLLTEDHKECAFCSPRWEFRADRAAMPLSALCCKNGAAAIFIQPYSDTEDNSRGYIRNGVFAELPDRFGVTLGYTNDPITFKNRSIATPSLRDTARKAEASGSIFMRTGKERTALHAIIRAVYEKVHHRAAYQKSFREALKGMLETFCYENYDKEAGEYTNENCQPPGNAVLKPWRNVVEIGWTGGAILAYPLVLARELLGEEAKEPLAAAMDGERYLDRIADCYNEKSGLLYDLMAPIDESGSRVNGWWTYYGLVKDCHCAYTVGSAVHYMLKTIAYLKKNGRPWKEHWLDVCRKVLDTVVSLQREDGAFGYTYSISEKKVLDWSGFAGCWFVPSLAYLAELTGDGGYLEPAKKALRYYHTFVKDLNCYGAPMDTWKSIDEEGNLAFIRGSRLLYEQTGEPEFLECWKDGAEYEFLWRYAYPTRPEFAPVCDGWNACGGSVTSISNPHIHPMGVLVDSDLYELAKVTGDGYYRERALDSTAWMMQTLELYPEKTGYGRYGVLSERWCPSDGLTVERDSEGNGFSSWFSYNLWAAANVMEAVAERYGDE
ncbi:MAG: hypothetical protein Q4F41_06630 [Eubacteriales bacterium]|nr:hypothetical protein [Eubacteriales bacterium]